jgi:hypothetical protein
MKGSKRYEESAYPPAMKWFHDFAGMKPVDAGEDADVDAIIFR